MLELRLDQILRSAALGTAALVLILSCRPRIDGPGHGKTEKFPVAAIAQQVVAKYEFRQERRGTVSASDSITMTFGASLGNHFSLY